MDIIYKLGSILNAPEPYIVHGCNAQGKMGSGVAKVLMDRYPEVKERYLDLYEYYQLAGDPFLGTIHRVLTSGDHTVFNAITQEHFGYDGKLYASYDAIEQCMGALDETMYQIGHATGEIPHVAMPLLGCGLAGGDWNVVSAIIEKKSNHFQPVVYTLKPL